MTIGPRQLWHQWYNSHSLELCFDGTGRFTRLLNATYKNIHESKVQRILTGSASELRFLTVLYPGCMWIIFKQVCTVPWLDAFSGNYFYRLWVFRNIYVIHSDHTQHWLSAPECRQSWKLPHLLYFAQLSLPVCHSRLCAPFVSVLKEFSTENCSVLLLIMLKQTKHCLVDLAFLHTAGIFPWYVILAVGCGWLDRHPKCDLFMSISYTSYFFRHSVLKFRWTRSWAICGVWMFL